MLAARIGRHAAIYGMASVATFAFGMVSVAVVTRFLAPAAFGDLSLLLLVLTLTMVVCNAGILQGTNYVAFGGAGGDEDGGIDDGTLGGHVSHDPRRALTSGLVLTIAIGAGVVGCVAATSEPLARYLFHEGGHADLVILAAAGGAVTATWRLLLNSLRLGRRPAAFVVASIAHAAFPIVASVVLLSWQPTVASALGGVAVGNAAAAITTMLLTRRNLRAAVSWHDARSIWRLGRVMVLLILATSFIQLTDVLFVSRYVAASDVGMYRIATRIGAVSLYWSSAFFMAWGPLRRDAIQTAADQLTERRDTYSAFSTYFLLITAGVFLGIGAFADDLVRIAAPAYSDAARYIPLATLGFAAHAVFILIYRTAMMPTGRSWLVAFATFSAIVFALSSIVLIPWLGAYGASLATILAWGLAAAGMVIRARQEADPVRFELRRILAGLAIAGGLYAVAALCNPGGELTRTAVDLVCVLAYPVLLLATGVVPNAHLRAMRTLVPHRDRELLGRWQRLDPGSRALLTELVVAHRDPAEVAERRGETGDAALAAMVVALRALASDPTPATAHDADIGRYLTWTGAFAERDQFGHELFAAPDVDPLAVDRLDIMQRAIRRKARAHRLSAPPPPTAPSGAAAALPRGRHRRVAAVVGGVLGCFGLVTIASTAVVFTGGDSTTGREAANVTTVPATTSTQPESQPRASAATSPERLVRHRHHRRHDPSSSTQTTRAEDTARVASEPSRAAPSSIPPTAERAPSTSPRNGGTPAPKDSSKRPSPTVPTATVPTPTSVTAPPPLTLPTPTTVAPSSTQPAPTTSTPTSPPTTEPPSADQPAQTTEPPATEPAPPATVPAG